jgi:hypothetical protein
MSETSGPHDFVYVHTDIPEGVTFREWHERRAEERRTQVTRRRPSRVWRLGLLARIARLPLTARAVVWRDEVRHSSDAHGSMST